MLYVSHDLPSVEKLCHRVGVVDHGRLAANDGPGLRILRTGT